MDCPLTRPAKAGAIFVSEVYNGPPRDIIPEGRSTVLEYLSLMTAV